MICPACGFANEDGVLYCEKCKADLEMPAAGATRSAVLEEEPIALEPIDRVYPAVEPDPIELEPVTSGDVSTTSLPSVGTVSSSSTTDLPAMPSAGPPPLPPKTADYPAPPPTATSPTPPATLSPKLVVVRGQRIDLTYPLYGGKNYLGRTDDKPVDIDLTDQEAVDRVWASRQHAVITLENGKLILEDLSSLNGTFVNRTRVHPGELRELQENDVVQVGTVHMKVVMG